MKNIVIFIPSIESGGVEKNLFYIINHIQYKFERVFLVSADKFKDKKLGKNIKLLSPSSRYYSNKSRIIKSLVCFYIIIKNFWNKEILIFSLQSNFFSTIASKLINSKIILRLNTSPEKYSTNFIKKFIFKILYSLADKIIVNSYEFKNNFKNYYNLDSTVILNPLNISKAKKKISFFKNFNQLKIISIGRLTHQKDHITLLRSLKLLKYKFKVNFRLYLIGKGYNFNLLSNFIKNYGLQKNIKLAGYKKNAFEYIKSSDLLVLTSRYEGLPNVLIEAQASGIPVISSKCPSGPREILMNGKLGELFKVGDYKGLSKKIFNFSENKKILRKKSILAKKYLYRYDYNTNLNKYTKILKDNID